MTFNTVIFKGEVITKGSGGSWYIDFNEFDCLYKAKGHVLRKIRGR